MANFTLDDFNDMKRDEADFFGPSDDNMPEEFAPSAKSLSFIKDYNRSLSYKQTRSIGAIAFHIN